MREDTHLFWNSVLIAVVIVGAVWAAANAGMSAASVDPPAETADVVDITAEAASCLRPLDYRVAETTVVREVVSAESIAVGPSSDFIGSKWNLEDSISPIDGAHPRLTPMEALDACVGEMTASRGYGVNPIEEHPAPQHVTASIQACMTEAGYGPDRVTLDVLQIGESRQMRLDTMHFLPESELKPFGQTLSKCMLAHIESAEGP
jgi:hypothetical protein